MLPRVNRWLVLWPLLLLEGCMWRGSASLDESALPRESRDTPPPVPLKNFLKDKETRATPGLFVTYSYRTKSYMLVQKQQLGKPLMLMGTVSQGGGQLVGGGPLGSQTSTNFLQAVLLLERHGNRLYLIEPPHSYLDQPAHHKAVKQTFSPTVIASIPIVAEDRGGSPSGDMLVSLDELLLDDLAATVPVGKDRQKPQRRLSYVEKLSGSAVSTSLRVRLGYSTAASTELGHLVNAVSVTYSFLQLPDTPMQRRQADDRIGTFSTAFRDFHSRQPRMESYAVLRWRLTPSHKEGTLLVPKQPIVFYLDPATPKVYQPYILDGVRQWNRAFEAAGWKDAVRAAVLPSQVAPDDPRAAVIHWETGEGSLNGRAQPVIDPRSGEILSASLLLSINPLRQHLRLRKTVLGPVSEQESEKESGKESGKESLGAALDADEEELGAVLGHQTEVLRATLHHQGIAAGEPFFDELLGRRLRLLAMHEVGHALGLRHNFRASTHTPSAQLGSPEWFKKNALLSSVMDYPSINLPPPLAGLKSEAEFPYYQSTIGPSDVLSIAYAYTPDAAYAAHLANQAAKWGYDFGSDEEADSEADPSVQRWDLGGEPLLWAKDRTTLLRELWRKLGQRRLAPGDRPADVTQTAASLLRDYARTVAAVTPYLGGHYGSRDHIGDAGGKPAQRPVEKSKQSAALAFLLDAVLTEQALPMTAELAEQLGVDHLRPLRTRRQTEQPVMRQWIDLRVQLLQRLLEAPRLRRMVDGEQAFGRNFVLTVGELLDKLTQSLFAELYVTTPGPISPLRRELQLRYVEQLGQLVLRHTPDSRPARSQARYQLQQLQSQLSTLRPKHATLDVDTLAHVLELSDTISATVNGAMVIQSGSAASLAAD